ncbi:MAG: class I SAM-dependent methyltransferase, partial [bacterium]|nr:class I SAM-dependent methyltransferase [bacterium]
MPATPLPPTPTPSRRTTASILQSVDATPDLLPHLSDLFRGIPNLGSSPASVLRLARALGLGPTSRILELACGKGSTTLQLARQLGCSVTASDAFPPFIEAANLACRKAALTHLCSFQLADLHKPLPFKPRTFDAALMIGFWPFDRAAQTLRTFTTRGGIYIMDDALLTSPATSSRLSHIATVDDAAQFIHSLGDEPLIALPFSPASIRRMHQSLARRLARNAATLELSHPPLRASLRAFIRRQVGASEHLTGLLRPVLLA